ncbi:MAG: LPXTG cell wall anchor domain-containing protein, partial [Candidatus Pelethousia sp.]|nr:LPXTG cell wall anchor domain-containing protein [Candidatus Pelethousia sp.]
AIREAQKDGQFILGYDISLNRGFIAPLTVSIPVSSQYNGQTVTILHCINGRLESIVATVTNGVATFAVTVLSPFAVTTGLLVPDSVVIDPPKTGDAATPCGFALIGLAAACAGYTVMKRRRG